MQRVAAYRTHVVLGASMTVDEALPGIKRLLVQGAFSIGGIASEMRDIDERISTAKTCDGLKKRRSILQGQITRRKNKVRDDVTGELERIGRNDLIPCFVGLIDKRLEQPGALDLIYRLFDVSDDRKV